MSRKENLGPKAAAGNRQALIAAAAEVFAERGLDAPLSEVAKRAGVGQGSLYRHFPDRISLALTAFEENIAAVETLVAADSTTLRDVLDLLTRQAIASVAFIQLVGPDDDDERIAAASQRIRQALSGPLDTARAAGEVPPTLTVTELALAVGMMAAYVAKRPPGDRRRSADACWTLLSDAIGLKDTTTNP